jgi:hypothetical protein
MAITLGGSWNTTNLMCYLDASSYSGSGTIWTDLSGNGRNGTLVGSPTFSNNSFVFNGTNYVSLGNFGVFPANGTISFLLNSTAVENYRNPFHTHYNGTANNFGIRFEQTTAGSIGIVVGNDAGTASGLYILDAGFNPNSWYYLTVTWNTATNTAISYVNGVQKTSISNTYWATQMPTVTIGGGFNTDRLFKGAIANVSIYNRTLTQAEIASNYAALGVTYNDSSVQVAPFTSTTDTGKLLSISTFAATGTWTKPSGCTNVVVKVVGGGGGGASYCESGGAGGFSEKRIDVTQVSTVAVTVGGGGPLAVYSGGNAGGTSSFGSYCSATGGYGSNQNFGHTGGFGGIGSSGDINLYGGSGTGHGNSMGNGAIGKGGHSYWGGNSNLTGRHQNPGGTRPAAPGAGGTGGVTNENFGGQGGMSGLVVVWEYK